MILAFLLLCCVCLLLQRYIAITHTTKIPLTMLEELVTCPWILGFKNENPGHKSKGMVS